MQHWQCQLFRKGHLIWSNRLWQELQSDQQPGRSLTEMLRLLIRMVGVRWAPSWHWFCQSSLASRKKFTFLPIRLIAAQNQETKDPLFQRKESGRNMIHHLYFRSWVVGFEARVRDHYVVAKRGMWPLFHTADVVLLSASVQRTRVSGLTSAAAPHKAQVVEACHLVLHHAWGVAQLSRIILVVARHDCDHRPIGYVSQSNHLWEERPTVRKPDFTVTQWTSDSAKL